ncbi:hypothetical protein [Sabulicella glaciei]|uniref:Uncharacterized protein n=1 Tax=Sabulicella glaciei TaxID=2984948 RepID=A0ABT3P1C9_9PROT|nr:hypothetical protein [Roseococcus sp. MDT2-1-1]MCW8088225.1 hypothetical protein [Roseococcus sp. MDT2-1-1]
MAALSVPELENRMVAYAERVLEAAKPAREGQPDAYTFDGKALNAVWLFIQGQSGAAARLARRPHS